MKLLLLENALRKIASTGDSDIVYGIATPIGSIIQDPDELKKLITLLNIYISDFEKKTGKKTHR